MLMGQLLRGRVNIAQKSRTLERRRAAEQDSSCHKIVLAPAHCFSVLQNLYTQSGATFVIAVLWY
jgi:hypothetical protein